jgi:hypothetical protein
MNEPLDMSAFCVAKSDQLNADDLISGPRTITITKVTAQADSADQPVSIHYEGGEGRPFKPCKTVRRIMVGVWGKDASKYVGRSMTLYRDPSVSFGGMQVGGIRVSHMSHIEDDKTVALLVTRGRKAPFKIKPLKLPPAEQKTDAFGLAPVTEGPAKARQTPQEWLNGYLSEIDDCSTIDDLMALQARRTSALAKLQAEHPQLHEEAVEAGAKKAQELQAIEA